MKIVFSFIIIIFLKKSVAASLWAASFIGGLDETRTRDPMRDRHVF